MKLPNIGNLGCIELDELIKKLEACAQEKPVYYDFVNFYPTKLHSYRGYYEQLALGYSDDLQGAPTVSQLIILLKRAVNTLFQGYKGGNFLMSDKTPVWVANNYETGGTAIVDVIESSWCIILKTESIDK